MAKVVIFIEYKNGTTFKKTMKGRGRSFAENANMVLQGVIEQFNSGIIKHLEISEEE